MGVSHRPKIVVKKGVYSGRVALLAYLRGGGYILGGRGRFWEGGIDSGSVTYSCRKGGIFWMKGIDSGSVTL